MRSLLLAGLAIAFSLTAAGCGDDVQTDYSAQNRGEFFAACTAPLSDRTLVTRICSCVFETAQKEIPYERFVEIENAIIADPVSPLAPDVAEIIATCILDEAEL